MAPCFQFFTSQFCLPLQSSPSSVLIPHLTPTPLHAPLLCILTTELIPTLNPIPLTLFLPWTASSLEIPHFPCLWKLSSSPLISFCFKPKWQVFTLRNLSAPLCHHLSLAVSFLSQYISQNRNHIFWNLYLPHRTSPLWRAPRDPYLACWLSENLSLQAWY